MTHFDNIRQGEDNIMAGQPGRIDQFLLMHSARLDNWREITARAEAWQAGSIERAELLKCQSRPERAWDERGGRRKGDGAGLAGLASNGYYAQRYIRISNR